MSKETKGNHWFLHFWVQIWLQSKTSKCGRPAPLRDKFTIQLFTEEVENFEFVRGRGFKMQLIWRLCSLKGAVIETAEALPVQSNLPAHTSVPLHDWRKWEPLWRHESSEFPVPSATGSIWSWQIVASLCQLIVWRGSSDQAPHSQHKETALFSQE